MTPEERAELCSIIAEACATAVARVLAPTVPTPAPRSASRVGLLTLEEAGELIRTPAKTIRYWTQQGRLRAYKPGRLLLVKEAELLALVDESATNGWAAK